MQLARSNAVSTRPAAAASRRAPAVLPKRGALVVRRFKLDDISGEESNVIANEWPMNWSLASYEDLTEYYKNEKLKKTTPGGAKLRDVMSRSLTTTTPDATLDSIRSKFSKVSGLPVLDAQSRLVGVISRKDLEKRGTYVKDVMTTPPIATGPETRVADAAAMMLKHKIHRIPVVDRRAQVVGMVTRTDIFTALEKH